MVMIVSEDDSDPTARAIGRCPSRILIRNGPKVLGPPADGSN
jgi:hypothetical protein